LGWSGEAAQPIRSSVHIRGWVDVQQVVEGEGVYQSGINAPHNPSTDILHSPAYEDGTDSEFRNVGN